MARGRAAARRRRSRCRHGQADPVARRARSPGDGRRAAAGDDRPPPARRLPRRPPSKAGRRRSRSRRRAPTSSRPRRRSTGSTTAPRSSRSHGCCGPAAASRSSGTCGTRASRGSRELSERGRTDAASIERVASSRSTRAGCSGLSSRPSFSSVQEVDRATLLDLVLSRSYCAVLLRRSGPGVAERRRPVHGARP